LHALNIECGTALNCVFDWQSADVCVCALSFTSFSDRLYLTNISGVDIWMRKMIKLKPFEDFGKGFVTESWMWVRFDTVCKIPVDQRCSSLVLPRV